MGLRINTNVSSIRALRNLRANDRNQARSLERLSTGLRINRGSDDPSGLVISEQLRSQVAALQQATTNSQNAMNLISVADAALGEVSNLLFKSRIPSSLPKAPEERRPPRSRPSRTRSTRRFRRLTELQRRPVLPTVLF